MNYYNLNKGLKILNLFLLSYFATYFFSIFIGISPKEAKILGFIMLISNIIIISYKKIVKILKNKN